jgi:predicted ATP-grasp superfamily ATP-dependent carboligase
MTAVGSPRTGLAGAIVLGADYRGLGIVRSLGRRGIPVVVLRDDEDHGSAPSSRYCTETLRWPRSDEDRDELLAALADRSATGRWALFPTGDETAAYVARRHEALARHFVLTTPEWETFRWAYDKRLTYRLARCTSVEHPRTCALEDRRDAAAHDGPFPVLLKPAMKPRRSRLTHDKAWVVGSTNELLARYDEAVALGDGDILMLQELVPRGEQVSFAALWRDGDPVVSVCARRSRQYPLDIGRSSTYVETIHDDELGALSTRLAARLRLSGMAEMEFVRTPEGGYSLLDLNARVWGWHTICREAGLDFPYLTWLQCTGHEVPRMHAGAGHRWRRLITDVPAAGAALARRQTTVGTCVASLVAPHERAVFARDDPLPGLLELPAFLWSRRRHGPDTRRVPSDSYPGSVAGCAP